MAYESAGGFAFTFPEKALNNSALIRHPAGSEGGHGGEFRKRAADELIESNRQLARQLQADVLKRIKSSTTRKSVSTGRLLKVTANPANFIATEFRMGVGDVDFLDSSVAKYWRTFEEGSAEAWKKRSIIGLPLHGFFYSSIIGYKATRYPGPQPQPLAGGDRQDTPGQRPVDGKLRFPSREFANKLPRNAAFVVGKQIEPRRAYAKAAAAANLGQRARKDMEKYIRTAFLSQLTPAHQGFYRLGYTGGGQYSDGKPTFNTLSAP